MTKQAGKLVTDIFNRKFIPTEEDDSLVKVKYISYNGINYLPQDGTPEDLLRESVMVVRETPLDTLMEDLKVKLAANAGQHPQASLLLLADGCFAERAVQDRSARGRRRRA